jgi:hypothetical protein
MATPAALSGAAQGPNLAAAERDEAAVTAWRDETWPVIRMNDQLIPEVRGAPISPRVDGYWRPI